MNLKASTAPQPAATPPTNGGWRWNNQFVVDVRRPCKLPDRCPVTGEDDDLEEAEFAIRYVPVANPAHRQALLLSTGIIGASWLEARFGERLRMQGAISSTTST